MPSPIKARKISHVVLNVADVERSIKFYTEILGLKFSDYNDRGMAFLRYNNDHHGIAFAPAPAGATLAPDDKYITFNHMALEVDSIDELFKAREFLKANGIAIDFEGRRGPCSNIGIEFRDPDGYHIELACDMEQVGWDGRTRPPALHRRANSLEEAAAAPMPTELPDKVGV